MAEPIDFDSDDVLGFEEDEQPGRIRVLLKNGATRVFSDEEADRVREILNHFTPPTA